MITILKYVLLGILFYIVIIPILEQLSALICQWIENLKGILIYKQTKLQQQLDKIITDKDSLSQTTTNVIGFSIPTEEEYEEEEDEND